MLKEIKDIAEQPVQDDKQNNGANTATAAAA
jgi:hypothetical protein